MYAPVNVTHTSLVNTTLKMQDTVDYISFIHLPAVSYSTDDFVNMEVGGIKRVQTVIVEMETGVNISHAGLHAKVAYLVLDVSTEVIITSGRSCHRLNTP